MLDKSQNHASENTDTRYGISSKTQGFLNRSKKLYIDGQWRAAKSGANFPTINPATEQEICTISKGGAADIDVAVLAARRAFETGPWPKMTPADRQNLVLRLADLLENHRQTLAEIETIDNGKPLSESLDNVDGTIAYMRYMAGWATKIGGRTATSSAPGNPFTYTLKEPVGVVGAIIPWNLPISMAAWKVVPALVTGCTVVLKPAEQTSLTALYIAALIEEAGCPKGVFNLVTGMGAEAGAALVSHPGIDKIAFTGSTNVGKILAAAAAQNVTKTTLELGGKSPMVVLADCDIQKAASGAAGAIFYNQGQLCCAGSRLYVHKSIYDKVVSGVADIAGSIRLANGLDTKCDMGPLVSKRQMQTVNGYIEAGKSEGATIAAGGKTGLKQGYFVRPTVLSDTTNDMKVVREEIFGPVLVAAPFDDIEDAVRMANDTPYGLGASIWSNDLAKVNALIPRMKAGLVWVNTHNLVDPCMPFGGIKASGYGRELGSEQLDSFLETKMVWLA